MTERKFDFLVYGATGFTGKQASRYLLKTNPQAKVAIAGRNLDKLKALASDLNLSPSHILVADCQEPEALGAAFSQCRIVVNTAGPFSLYGEAVIKSCIEQGCDYVDITGETPFIKDMIDRYHDAAVKRGVRIVPFCGFDSIPSDLGTLWIIDNMRSKGWRPRLVKSFYRMKGGFNGGTVASALTMAESGQVKRLRDPQLLNPEDCRDQDERRRSYEPQKPIFDDDLKIWSAPFFMAPINAAVVRRSRALYRQMHEDYGPQFEYHERFWTDRQGRWLPASVASLLSTGFALCTLNPIGRKLIKKLSPKPGEGPSDESMDGGYFACRFLGKSEEGHTLTGEIRGSGDPGNRITIKMLCESARLLHDGRDELAKMPHKSGILTPATAFGLHLKPRLEQQGISFNMLEA